MQEVIGSCGSRTQMLGDVGEGTGWLRTSYRADILPTSLLAEEREYMYK
jgi:hypothetical protein